MQSRIRVPSHTASRPAGEVARKLLGLRFPIGLQYGKPVEVTVAEALRETPFFLVAAALIGLILFV